MQSRPASERSGSLKNQEAKFTGKTEQLFSDYKTQYDLVTRDFGVRVHQKMLLFHNLLDGEALRFDMDEVMRTSVSYETTRAKIEGRFLHAEAAPQARAGNSELLRTAWLIRGALMRSSACFAVPWTCTAI